MNATPMLSVCCEFGCPNDRYRAADTADAIEFRCLDHIVEHAVAAGARTAWCSLASDRQLSIEEAAFGTATRERAIQAAMANARMHYSFEWWGAGCP